MGRMDFEGAPIEGVTGNVAGSTDSNVGSALSAGFMDPARDAGEDDNGNAGIASLQQPAPKEQASFADRVTSKLSSIFGMNQNKSLGENIADQLTPGGKTPLGILSAVPRAVGASQPVSAAISLANYMAGQAPEYKQFISDKLLGERPDINPALEGFSFKENELDAMAQNMQVPSDIENLQEAVYNSIASGEFADPNLPRGLPTPPTDIPADFARPFASGPIAMPQEVRDMREEFMPPSRPTALPADFIIPTEPTPQQVADVRPTLLPADFIIPSPNPAQSLRDIAPEPELGPYETVNNPTPQVNSVMDALMRGVDNYTPNSGGQQVDPTTVADASEFFTSVFGNIKAPFESVPNTNLIRKGNVYTSGSSGGRKTRSNRNQGGIFGTGKTLANMIGFGST